jgi:hypothetical protein
MNEVCYENTLFLLDASKDVRGEINEQKTKYMFMYHYQRTGQTHNIKVANKSFEKCGKV